MQQFLKVVACALSATVACVAAAGENTAALYFPNDKVLHKDESAANKVMNAASLEQLLLESAGLPSTQMDKVSGEYVADVFHHNAATVFVMVQGTEEGVDALLPEAKKNLAKAQDIEVSEDASFSAISASLAASSFKKFGTQGSVLASAYGATHDVFAQETFPQPNAGESANIEAVSEQLAKREANVNPTAPEIISVTVAGEKDMSASKAAMDKLFQELDRVYKEKYGLVMVGLKNAEETAMAANMRLLATAANGTDDAATNGDIPMPFSGADIVNYQVALWTAIALVAVLFLAVCSMTNMDVGRDSLLYAKFQADTSRKTN